MTASITQYVHSHSVVWINTICPVEILHSVIWVKQIKDMQIVWNYNRSFWITAVAWRHYWVISGKNIKSGWLMISTTRKSLPFTLAVLQGFRKFFQARHIGRHFNLKYSPYTGSGIRTSVYKIIAAWNGKIKSNKKGSKKGKTVQSSSPPPHSCKLLISR